MEIKNIVEICVGIDIAILGIAYPIIVDKITSIGEKYNSNYLLDLFYYEYPQKKLYIFKKYHVSLFNIVLYATILSFVFLIFPIPPLFGWNNFIINNSANLLVLTLTTVLTFLFFVWVNNVMLFSGKPTTLLKHLINKLNEKRENEEHYTYYLKAINEFTIYTIAKQDEHLQQSLLKFYNKEFSLIRRNHDKSKPLIYPDDLYFLIYNLNLELVNVNSNKVRAIEHRAVSGWWLFGEDIENITISDITYIWLWRNIKIIYEKEKLIREYWSSAFQYFDLHLSIIDSEFDYETGKVINTVEQEVRLEERKNFLEFHYALGGLLLFKGQYKSIKCLFEYTQSSPPRYVLLPENMNTIFTWLQHFQNQYRYQYMSVDLKYPFPELDSLGTSRKIIYWINYYIALLFIRQFTLNKFYTFQNFTSQINLPTEIIDLKSILENIPLFEKCLNDLMNNEALLLELEYNTIVQTRKEEIQGYLPHLKKRIEDEIGFQEANAPLGGSKIDSFKKSTSEIISNVFEEYSKISNQLPLPEKFEGLKLVVQGGNTLFPRTPFIDNAISHANYDTIFAQHISDNIKFYIANAFSIAKTKSYLIYKELVLDVFNKIIADNSDVIIIGLRISYDTRKVIDEIKEKIIEIPASNSRIRDRFFILRKKHLPWLTPRDLNPEKIKENKLDEINKKYKIYASVLEYKQEDVDSDSKGDHDEETEAKVQLIIAFITSIYWQNDRDIIQIDLFSKYEEKGVPNDINEIEPLKSEENETN